VDAGLLWWRSPSLCTLNYPLAKAGPAAVGLADALSASIRRSGGNMRSSQEGDSEEGDESTDCDRSGAAPEHGQ
jgi:hypothetical protein